ncbi:MAG: hypothetical protein FWG02_10820 [Holophagaceae bacterium]|nr:hypothetical protein [Holophagaceae bacterium]
MPWLAIFISYRILNAPLTFYSIVLDQDNNPVQGVEVRATIRGWTPLVFLNPFAAIHDKTIFRKTDNFGRFSVKGYYGRNFFFSPYAYNQSERSFQKDGYEYLEGDQSTFFWILPKSDKNYIKPDRNSPTIFRMRKFEELSHLLSRDELDKTFSPATNEHLRFCDVIKNIQFAPDKKLDNGGRPLFCDFSIHCEWEELYNRWKITVASGDEKGGIQIRNDKLYTAPENGYKPSIVFYVTKNSNNAVSIFLNDSRDGYSEREMVGYRKTSRDKYYFYLRSRDCELYSRVAMRVPSLRNGMLSLYYDITTNPYAGQRSLELEPNISYELKRALDKEIKDAFAKDPNAIIPPPTPEMFKMPDSQIPQIMAERQRLISK